MSSHSFPTRRSSDLRSRVPYVGSVGALDMVNFRAIDTVPAHYSRRNLHCHNPQVTLMRTTAEESRQIGGWIAEKLNRCRQLIQDAQKPPAPSQASTPDTVVEMPAERHRCPHCGNGRMIIVERFERGSSPTMTCAAPVRVDNTS